MYTHMYIHIYIYIYIYDIILVLAGNTKTYDATPDLSHHMGLVRH